MSEEFSSEFPYIKEGDPMDVINLLWDEVEFQRNEVERQKYENRCLIEKNKKRINDTLLVVKVAMVSLFLIAIFIISLYYVKDLPITVMNGVDIIVVIEFILTTICYELRK